MRAAKKRHARAGGSGGSDKVFDKFATKLSKCAWMEKEAATLAMCGRRREKGAMYRSSVPKVGLWNAVLYDSAARTSSASTAVLRCAHVISASYHCAGHAASIENDVV